MHAPAPSDTPPDTPAHAARPAVPAEAATKERMKGGRARLTDRAVRLLKSTGSPFRLWDGEGLYLQVSAAGSKLWRLRYYFGGREKLLALGAYPEVGLKDARERALDARRKVANGIDPGAERQAEKQTGKAVLRGDGTLEVVAREWHARFAPTWAPDHATTQLRRLERDVFPWLGARPVAEIAAPEVLSVLRRVEERGAAETAHRVKVICGQVFRYAVATGRADRDPTVDLRGALAPVPERHFAAVTDPAQLARILRALDGYEGTLPVRVALRLQALLFVRPGELRTMRWEHVDLDGALWTFTASKTKQPHTVPLAPQAVALLRELKPLTGGGPYVFPCARLRSAGRPMSEATVNAALRRCGVDTKAELTGHGFRAVARTILEERLGFRPEVVELQLAHRIKDPLGRAYNRTQHLEERTRMMARWADFLDELRVAP